MPNTPPANRLRFGTPLRLRLRPGSTYLATTPASATTVAAPSTTHLPTPWSEKIAHTSTAAQDRISPGSTGTITPRRPMKMAAPQRTVRRSSPPVMRYHLALSTQGQTTGVVRPRGAPFAGRPDAIVDTRAAV